MKSLTPIVLAWGAIDAELQTSQNIAQAKGWHRREAAIQNRRILNDRAYFLLMFAAFEAYVTGKAESMIQRRKASMSWQRRRGWDVLDESQMSKIPFINRLSYCLQRGTQNWNRVRDYYGIRNDLAHTGATAQPFAINVVATHLEMAAGALKTYRQ